MCFTAVSWGFWGRVGKPLFYRSLGPWDRSFNDVDVSQFGEPWADEDACVPSGALIQRGHNLWRSAFPVSPQTSQFEIAEMPSRIDWSDHDIDDYYFEIVLSLIT